uniref:Secreted protein n=1 Tax=Haemonchus contortus TaxID=6289 RepID=A0A7I4YKK7_HAECO|nr:Protein F56B6.6 [Haemonchus contortus]
MRVTSLVILFSVAAAVPDCYLSFLEATTSCSTANDCPSGACVYSINQMKRVCCEPKKGSIQPKCPTGKPSAMPLLCDPNSNELDVCPGDYECRESTVEFEKRAGQPNYLCCR